ncbi:hypothetical protein KDL44_03290 [bacterium]|nr:hypothetical protein [bacterium]
MHSARMNLALLLLVALPLLNSCWFASQKGPDTTSPVETASIQKDVATPETGQRETTGGNVPTVQADLTYSTFDGGSGTISALAGKPTVVNMWAMW